MTEKHLYIGLMSGTSADGVDLALVDFNNGNGKLIAHDYQGYNEQLHQKIIRLYSPNGNEIDRAATLSVELAHYFSEVIERFIAKQKINKANIIAIGNHGQTIRHRPLKTTSIAYPFTMQIGCNQTLACLTGIRVIGDFRTKDVVLGGQGAPLVPAFHQYLLSNPIQDTFIVNLGGIANITFLPEDKQQAIIGFDTGPANALLDDWCFKHTGNRFDESGKWSAQGKINQPLLTKLLSDNYFSLPPPKSTGREYFTLAWLEEILADTSLLPVDIQATLCALTAYSIANEINKLSAKSLVYLCGGGIHNKECYKLIKQLLSGHTVNNIHTINLNNNAFEAMAFAWLAFAYDKKIYGNIPTVTGARKACVLGVEFTP